MASDIKALRAESSAVAPPIARSYLFAHAKRRRQHLILSALVLIALASRGYAEDQNAFATEFRTYFSGLTQVDQLCEDLGSDTFAVRERAMQQLIRLPVAPRAKLQDLVDGGNPEVQWRARLVLKRAASNWNRASAMIERLRRENISGMGPEVLALLEMCDNDRLEWELEQALVSTTRDADESVLRKALGRSAAAARRAAVVALTLRGTETATQALLKHGPEPDDSVRLALGEGLVKLGRHEGLLILAGLLDAKDVPLRTRAATMLQSATGHDEGFFSADTADKLAQVAIRWRTWVSKEGNNIPLRRLESTVTGKSPFD